MPLFGVRLVMAVVTLSLLASRATAQDPPYAESVSAFMRHDLAGAERAARTAIAHDTSAAHRLDAALMLGAIEWRVRRDTATASRWLTSAAAMTNGRARAFAERARMLNGTGHAAAASTAARTALAAATDAPQRRAAIVQLATAAAEPLISAQLAPGSPRAPTAADRARLRPIVDQLSAEVRENPGELDPATLLVTLGALANDGPAILLGWNSYYLVGATGATSALLAGPRRVLEMRLAHWTPADSSQSVAIAAALADSRFFTAAAIVASEQPRDKQMRDIVVYTRFVRSLERLTDDYYRATALKKGNAKAWKREIDLREHRLWRELSFASARPYRADSLEAELDRHFGTVINLGSTAGYDDLHMGHRVIDERRTVKQYGHEAVVRIVALDAMVSNGFQSWAWDGRASHGGWGGGESITQVRPSYARGPLRAWRAVSDSTKQRELRDAERADSVSDIATGRAAPVAYFPGLASRLEIQGQHAILDSLRASGLSGAALKGSFVGEYERVLRESSIFAHEGRHVIDGTLGKFSDEDLEFRAKLSEIAFAPNPRLAMDAITGGDLGEDTPHGRANRRVLTGLLAWMTGHSRDIRGLDASLPILPQMTLLTDDQLRKAFASMDPLSGAR